MNMIHQRERKINGLTKMFESKPAKISTKNKSYEVNDHTNKAQPTKKGNGSRDINRHVDEDDYLDGVTIRASIGRCCPAN